MHRVLAHEGRAANLAAMLVWIDMLPEDPGADIPALVGEMADPRIQWFHDPRRRAGRAIAASLGSPDKVAWDVYLFFDAQAQWKDRPPAALGWTHQLSDPWADPVRCRPGAQLEPELARLLRSILHP